MLLELRLESLPGLARELVSEEQCPESDRRVTIPQDLHTTGASRNQSARLKRVHAFGS